MKITFLVYLIRQGLGRHISIDNLKIIIGLSSKIKKAMALAAG